jgi:hypothetical protein
MKNRKATGFEWHLGFLLFGNGYLDAPALIQQRAEVVAYLARPPHQAADGARRFNAIISG